MAINQGWTDLSREKLKELFVAVGGLHSQVSHDVRSEYAFGMSTVERIKLLAFMKSDLSNTETKKSGYTSKFFSNPDAINSLREAARQWNRSPGKDISSISSSGLDPFFNELVQRVPAEHQESVSALINQPQGYFKPLPGTAAEALQRQHLLQATPAPVASNQGIPVAASSALQPAMQPGHAPGATATYVANLPSTGKRLFSYANGGPVSSNDPSTTFKRSRPDDVQQAASFSGIHPAIAVTSSSWAASNGMSRPAVQHPPVSHIPTVSDPAPRTTQAGALQGAGANLPSLAGQPSQSAPDVSAPHVFPTMPGPSQPGVPHMSDPELSRMVSQYEPGLMQFIDNLPPISPHTQAQIASSLPDPWNTPVLSTTPGAGQTAQVSFQPGAPLVQQPVATVPAATANVQAMPLAPSAPSTGQAGQTLFFNPFDPSDPLNGSVLPWTTTSPPQGQQGPR